jgi:hypothetical protein
MVRNPFVVLQTTYVNEASLPPSDMVAHPVSRLFSSPFRQPEEKTLTRLSKDKIVHAHEFIIQVRLISGCL